MLPRRLPRKPRREMVVRSPSHLRWVRSHTCSVKDCDGLPIEAAHVRKGLAGGTGMKPGDDSVISLCAECHRYQHQIGENAFERVNCMDLVALAAEFWQASPARQRAPRRRRCESCGLNWADPPSRLCPGCHAYRDHTGAFA